MIAELAPAKLYSASLQAGLGLISECGELLALWQPGMSARSLYQTALDAGRFPGMTARRLRNLVMEGFAPRFLVNAAAPARLLKPLVASLPAVDLGQIFLLYTLRAHPILADFLVQVYWPRYAAGDAALSNDPARAFVEQAVDAGRTRVRWSPATARRVAAYLTGCCADFGLLEAVERSSKRFTSFRPRDALMAWLAYDLHGRGVGDSQIPEHPEWACFGLDSHAVVDELRRLALRDLLIVQSSGELVEIAWTHRNSEGLCHVLARI
jgi:hypothetical protein